MSLPLLDFVINVEYSSFGFDAKRWLYETGKETLFAGSEFVCVKAT